MELQWPLILFTSFLAASAGVFGAQGVYALKDKGQKAQTPALFISLILLIIGGIAVFLHLQHWERIFNGFGNPTSGITQELVAIVVMVIIMVIYFVYIRRTAGEIKIPKWVAILAIVVSVVLAAVCAHSYMMPSRPAWDGIVQLLSVVGAACGFGPAVVAALSKSNRKSGIWNKLEGCGDDAYADDEGEADKPLNERVPFIGAIVNAVCTVAYLIYLCTIGSIFTQVPYYFDPVGPTRGINDVTSVSAFSGDAMTYSVCALLLVIVGVITAYMGKKSDNWKTWGAATALVVLIGAIVLRVVFYVLGISVFAFFDV